MRESSKPSRAEARYGGNMQVTAIAIAKKTGPGAARMAGPRAARAILLPALLLFACLAACDRRQPLNDEVGDGRPPILELSTDRQAVTAVKDTFLTIRAV